MPGRGSYMLRYSPEAMRFRAIRHHSARGFVELCLHFTLGSASAAASVFLTWNAWRASVELPQAEAELKAAGYLADIVKACAPEGPDAGNFGAVEPLRGIATREEDMTPEIKARVDAIKDLGIVKRKRDATPDNPQRRPSRAESQGAKTTPPKMPENVPGRPIDWAAWRAWMAGGLEWKVPTENDDAKAVFLALRRKTAGLVPSLLAAAVERRHASLTPSQRSRVAAGVQRGDVVIAFYESGPRIVPLVRALSLQMEAALAVGEKKVASDTAAIVFAIRDLSGSDHSLINYLVRVTFDRILCDIAQRNIAAGQMSATLLTEFQAGFAAESVASDFERFMVMELASFQYMMEQVVRKRVSLKLQSAGGLPRPEETKATQNPAVNRIAKIYYDRVKAARIRYFVEEMKALKNGGLIGYYRHAKAFDNEPNPGWLGLLWPHELLARGAARGYSGLMPGVIHNVMRRRMLVAACALERHRLAGGKTPDALTALPKALLPQIPPDLDGQPIRFRRGQNGWVLWSVGIDLKDDWNGMAPQPGKTADKDSPWLAADWQWRNGAQ
jgi:hypothetical protein